jgi:hypothetical protein
MNCHEHRQLIWLGSGFCKHPFRGRAIEKWTLVHMSEKSQFAYHYLRQVKLMLVPYFVENV